MKLKRTPFYFLRHGQTDWNLENRAQGQVDVPLNAAGIAQAESACALVQNLGIETICSSPLSRALDTAEIIGATLSKPIEVLPELTECSWGEKEGQSKTTWFPDWKNGIATPDGAEIYAEFLARALHGINRALNFPEPVLIVAHGGVYWAIQKYADLGAESDLPNCVPVYHEPVGERSTLWRTELIK